MSDYEEGSEFIIAGVISLHNAGHSNIPKVLTKLAREYKKDGLKAFLPPVAPTTCKIIPFPNPPDEIKS